MKKNDIAPKFYVYGCQELLLDLREIIDSAAIFEEEGKSPEQWLEYHEFFVRQGTERMNLTWGNAINMLIQDRTNELLEIRESRMSDYPF